MKFSELAKFFEKQRLASETAKKKKFTLYGGSRGPGKSYWIRWFSLWYLLYVATKFNLQHVRVGLFCEDYPTLRDRQISKIENEFPPWLGSVRDSQTQGFGFFLHEQYGGGMIALRNLDDPSKYKSSEFAMVAMEELTRQKLEVFNILRGSLRWSGLPAEWWKFVATTNPGDIGHLWVKSYWIDKNYPKELQAYANEFAFVKALPDDNPKLDALYWDELNSLPPDLAKAWRWGEWDVFEGQAFGQWRRDLHVVKPFEIPSHWRRWRGVDWGKRNPFCCLWGAQDPDTGRVVIYREVYEAELTDRQQAQLIKDLTGKDEKIVTTYGDPSMWTKKSFQSQTFSTADEYASAGVVLTPADNERLVGKRRVDTLLTPSPHPASPIGSSPIGEEQEVGLQIFETCANLIRTLPAMPYDKLHTEDVDSDAEDHAYDALRYLLTAIDPRAQPKKKSEKSEKKVEERLLKLVRTDAAGSRDL